MENEMGSGQHPLQWGAQSILVQHRKKCSWSHHTSASISFAALPPHQIILEYQHGVEGKANMILLSSLVEPSTK